MVNSFKRLSSEDKAKIANDIDSMREGIFNGTS